MSLFNSNLNLNWRDLTQAKPKLSLKIYITWTSSSTYTPNSFMRYSEEKASCLKFLESEYGWWRSTEHSVRVRQLQVTTQLISCGVISICDPGTFNMDFIGRSKKGENRIFDAYLCTPRYNCWPKTGGRNKRCNSWESIQGADGHTVRPIWWDTHTLLYMCGEGTGLFLHSCYRSALPEKELGSTYPLIPWGISAKCSMDFNSIFPN